MEIILLDHVDNLGAVGDTVRVKDGYARNFLLPRKLACLATKENLNYYKGLIATRQRKMARDKAAAETQAQRLAEITLRFRRRSRDEEARLFGSVTSADVAAELESKGFEIDKKRIVFPEPIKKLGEYTVNVRLHPEIVAGIKIVVESDQEA
jgi:large subunit ribosomal protein L9